MPSSFSGLFSWSLFWAALLLFASWQAGRYSVTDKVTYDQVEIRQSGAVCLVMFWLWYAFKAATNQDWPVTYHLYVVGASFILFLTATWTKWWEAEKRRRPAPQKRRPAAPVAAPFEPHRQWFQQ